MPVAISHTVLSYAADARIVSPNGDGRKDTVNLRFFLAQPAAVTLTLDAAFSSLPLLSANLSQGSQSFAFTGLTADGATVADGTYHVRLTVGSVAQSLPLVVDRAPPTVSLVPVSPLRPGLRARYGHRHDQRAGDQGEQAARSLRARKGRHRSDTARRRPRRCGQRVGAGHVPAAVTQAS